MNYLSRGIGNYYLPTAFGGGVELAIKDFEKAIMLDANSADAHLWLGIALRKLNRNATHRLALKRNLALALFRHERIITTVEKAKVCTESRSIPSSSAGI